MDRKPAQEIAKSAVAEHKMSMDYNGKQTSLKPRTFTSTGCMDRLVSEESDNRAYLSNFITEEGSPLSKR